MANPFDVNRAHLAPRTEPIRAISAALKQALSWSAPRPHQACACLVRRVNGVNHEGHCRSGGYEISVLKRYETISPANVAGQTARPGSPAGDRDMRAAEVRLTSWWPSRSRRAAV